MRLRCVTSRTGAVVGHRELERRMKPRTRADFEILYNELEAWRVAETHKIEVSEMSPEDKQQARYQLLLKEIKLVQVRRWIC